VHLLAAYLPGEGLALMQVEVDSRENEIVAAPRVLNMLDLRGKIVTGDALLTQRKLAVQIVEAGGEYVFPVKENQPDLKGYVEWPYAEQVFKLEREFQQLNTGKRSQEVVYGITSLMASEANAARLLEITRGHWGIESGLHYRRDVTLREDRCRVRMGQAPQVLAVINNLVLGLFARLGYTHAPEARRHFAAHLDEAVNLILLAQP
jgi:predicted transposase YbfD/YdcC